MVYAVSLLKYEKILKKKYFIHLRQSAVYSINGIAFNKLTKAECLLAWIWHWKKNLMGLSLAVM